MVAKTAEGRSREQLAATYSLISEWFLYPEEIDPAKLTDEVIAAAEAAAGLIDPAAADHLRQFHADRETIDLDDYLSLLELNPRCPLYLGSYQFQEPATCSAAGVSDRNQYMLEIGNVFRHFGFEIQAELPDFLPAVTEFLAMTVGSEGKDEQLRERFIERLVWPGVRLFADKLAAEETPYAHLAEALLLCLQNDLGRVPDPPKPTAKMPPRNGKQPELIQLEMAGAK